MGDDPDKTVTREITYHIEVKTELEPEWRTIDGGFVDKTRMTETIKFMRKVAKKFNDPFEYRAMTVITKRIKKTSEA